MGGSRYYGGVFTFDGGGLHDLAAEKSPGNGRVGGARSGILGGRVFDREGSGDDQVLPVLVRHNWLDSHGSAGPGN